MVYSEEKINSERHKEKYLIGLNSVIEKREKEAETMRMEYIEDVFENQEKYRKDLKKMLGWPLVGFEESKESTVTSEILAIEDRYTIYRMQFEILNGLNMTGIFFKANGQKRPLVIVQHGGLGTPEFISGFYGSTDNYNDMLKRVTNHGVHVFAPQLLLWGDSYDVEYDRKAVDARLKRVGSSIAAIEIFGIMKIIDYFEKQEYTSSFGMVGLSYGGFYTLYTAAIDTRIKSAISCSYFNKRDKYPWADWVWNKSAEKFDDAEVACLVYPRTLCIQIGNKDELFDYRYGEEAFEKLKTICKSVGTDWLNFKVFDGTHEFFKDEEAVRKLVLDIEDV